MRKKLAVDSMMNVSNPIVGGETNKLFKLKFRLLTRACMLYERNASLKVHNTYSLLDPN